MAKKKIKTIRFLGARWFQKTYGNTYHKVKVYVNGVQETSFAASGNPGQNDDLPFGLNGATCTVGCDFNAGSAGNYFGGAVGDPAGE